jgi:integrase/recombinase XerD
LQHLSKDELLRLLAAARNHSELEYLAILVGYWHGLRVSEITGGPTWITNKKTGARYLIQGFTPEAVRDGYLTIQRLKGSLKTTQPLVRHENPLLNERDQIMALVANSEVEKPVFRFTQHRFWMIMRRHCKTAGIAQHKSHPHILKHSIAMHTIKRAGIENVRTYLGHKSIASTGAYLKVDDDVASRAIARATDSAVSPRGPKRLRRAARQSPGTGVGGRGSDL